MFKALSRQENQKKFMGSQKMVMIIHSWWEGKNQSTQKSSNPGKGTGHRQEHRKPQHTPRMLGANGSVLDSGVGCHLLGGC